MKITKKRLKQIIKEELTTIMGENLDYQAGDGQLSHDESKEIVTREVRKQISAIQDPDRRAPMGTLGIYDEDMRQRVVDEMVDAWYNGTYGTEKDAKDIERALDKARRKKAYEAKAKRSSYDYSMRQTRDDLDPSQRRHRDYDPYADGD